jgi:Lon protease-like protein
MKQNSPFGVCLIQDGDEIGDAAKIYPIGCVSHIIDWVGNQDTGLSIIGQGTQCFKVISHHVQPNQLIMAEVEYIPQEAKIPLPRQYVKLAKRLRQFLQQLGDPYHNQPTYYQSATWVSQRLAEILPLPVEQQRFLLELEDPIVRLKYVEEIMLLFSFNCG